VQGSFELAIIRSDNIKNLANTLCISEIFCAVWADKGRSKPVSPYGAPPNGFLLSAIKLRRAFAPSSSPAVCRSFLPTD